MGRTNEIFSFLFFENNPLLQSSNIWCIYVYKKYRLGRGATEKQIQHKSVDTWTDMTKCNSFPLRAKATVHHWLKNGAVEGVVGCELLLLM